MMADGNKEYIGNFDVIKIVAATSIVFHHYQQISDVKFGGVEFYGGRFTFGYLVELFFIISGFLTEFTFEGGKKFNKWLFIM
ncbi:acyltransferase family protein [Butyrivibrio sp. FCS006]|uniref:acyltransferase family protein n=1 Tax=Butyrivibrio sp. FCS006 TaxID=1280684 RepID=UPI00047CDEC6|nr:acyltransferase family protein [Butyrivibrio sp. FCS006]